jgi:hypothetical protein
MLIRVHRHHQSGNLALPWHARDASEGNSEQVYQKMYVHLKNNSVLIRVVVVRWCPPGLPVL